MFTWGDYLIGSLIIFTEYMYNISWQIQSLYSPVLGLGRSRWHYQFRKRDIAIFSKTQLEVGVMEIDSLAQQRGWGDGSSMRQNVLSVSSMWALLNTYLTINGLWQYNNIFFSLYTCSCCLVSTMCRFFRHFSANVLFLSFLSWT